MMALAMIMAITMSVRPADVLVGVQAAEAEEEVVDLRIDFARVLKLEQPAATMIVGSPEIADATLSDNKTIVLTGKTAGTTNLIVLDDAGNQISQLVLRVGSRGRHLTTFFYGTRRQIYSCAQNCELVGGDEAAPVQATPIQSQPPTETTSTLQQAPQGN
jgi:hypothetical protein